MSAKRLFITGTGTGVGKTLITALLLRGCRLRGLRATTMKPIQTGANGGGDVPWKAPDLEMHEIYAQTDANLDAPDTALRAPYCYGAACSPHLAARMAGHYPDFVHIRECADTLARDHDVLLIEGAGGVLVPIDDARNMVDLALCLEAPAAVVSVAELGTINHTLLTLQALRAGGVPVKGVIMNRLERTTEYGWLDEDNVKTIERIGRVPVLGFVPYDAFGSGIIVDDTLKKIDLDRLLAV